MKHSKEPWKIGKTKSGGNAKRVVGCVNALAGIANPEAWVANLPLMGLNARVTAIQWPCLLSLGYWKE